MRLIDSPAVISLIVGLPTSAGVYFAYRIARQKDKADEQSSNDAHDVLVTAQVIDGMNKIAMNLQEDNRNLRLLVTNLQENLARIETQYRELTESCGRIERELDSMRRAGKPETEGVS